MDDEEEVLLALAETLSQTFLDYVGGPAHALHVIKILEKLCQLDEATVRDKVILKHPQAFYRPLKASRRSFLA
jgi:serine/threonine-protein phosphatase 2A regulatory subunit A